MEACGGSHHWARELQKLRHEVRLIAPQFVKPYVKGNKNDANDAEAICEAVGRPAMRFVSIKTVAQQDLQAVHRIRRELVRHRTAKANQIRGLLAEYGLVVGKRVGTLRRVLPGLLEDAQNGLILDFRELLEELRQDLAYLRCEAGSRVVPRSDQGWAISRPCLRRRVKLQSITTSRRVICAATSHSDVASVAGRLGRRRH